MFRPPDGHLYEGLAGPRGEGFLPGVHKGADRGAETVAFQFEKIYAFDGSIRAEKTPAGAGGINQQKMENAGFLGDGMNIIILRCGF